MKKDRISIEMKVGIFILATVLALLLFVVIQAKGGKYRGYDITAAFDYVAGLEAGSPVRVSGVRVGEVKDISIVYEKAPRVLVRMKIRQDVRISRFSRITIQTLGIIGEKYIEIAPGMDRQYLAAGDVIDGENPLSLERMADAGQSIVIRLNEILGDVRKITGEESLQADVRSFIKGSASAIESVDQTFRKMEELSEEISLTNKKIQEFIVAEGPGISRLIENTNSFVVSGKGNMEKVAAEISELAAEGKKSGQMFTDISGAAKEFRTASSGMQSLISDTSREMARTSESINQFFTRLQNEGFLARLMQEEDLVDNIKQEILLLHDATRQFSSTAKQINEFSVELNRLMSAVNQGEGSLGKVVSSDELYREIMDFIRDIKANPWKILIRRRK